MNDKKGKNNQSNLYPDKKEWTKALEKRTRQFAVRIIRLSERLPNTPEGRRIRDQLSGAGSSVGANYREANRAVSRADFSNKIDIVVKEASETQYWLEVVVDLEWLPWSEVREDYEECSQLLALFTSISSTAHKKK